MTEVPQNEFTFDVYGGVDMQLDALYKRNVERGIVSADDLANRGLSNAVEDRLATLHSSEMSSLDAREWINRGIDRATRQWAQYKPAGMQGFKRPIGNEGFETSLTELVDVKKALDKSGAVTPSGRPIGESMSVVAIPWQYFKDSLDQLPDAVDKLRSMQGARIPDALFAIENVIKSNQPFYIDWSAPEVLSTAREYLNRRIARDGSWGLGLMQIGEDAGIRTRNSRASADDITNNKRSFTVAGQNMGDLGIFEWLALTLQEETTDATWQPAWLLANATTMHDSYVTPVASLDRGHFDIQFDRSNANRYLAQPRLAKVWT